MDSKSLDIDNDIVKRDGSMGLCNHQQPWVSCTAEVCQEIWRLCRKSLREDRQVKGGRTYAATARKNRRKTKSQYDIALVKPQLGKREDHELKVPEELAENDSKMDQRKLLQNIFPDAITLRAGIQFRALTQRQAGILKAYFDSDERLPVYKRWGIIGEQVGCSGKTVEREFRALVRKFLKAAASGERGAVIEVVHVRGERRPRYYRKHSIQIGEWKRDWKELFSDKKVIRELRRTFAPMIRSKKTPVPSSPVNRLFGALIRHFASDLPGGDVRPYGISASDWEYNLRWAERLLLRKSPGLWTALEVYRILGRGAGLCRGCRTFLIRGFKINGSRITRAKECCNKACQMRAERRKDRRLEAAV